MKPNNYYLERTKKSADFYHKATRFLPGGVTANIKYFEPYPIVMEKADGAFLWDLDQNGYIDYNLCYGALVLGHGNEQIVHTLQEQLQQIGTMIFGTPHLLETEMAKKLVELYPSIESVRYTNSGLEATQLAIRLAMGWTGRRKLAKFEGHYHGGYDQVLISVNPPLRDQNERPSLKEDSRGIPDYYKENTIVLPFNDLEQTAEILQQNKDEIAAVIMEPIQGGFIPPNISFLKGLREITQKYGIVLIFDEVKTGFRVGLSGAQGRYGVTPDLTALGKVLGGGFPIGAIGGRKEIMDLCSPTGGADILTADSTQKKDSSSNVLFHSGTYNGHPLILAAGLATIQTLEEAGVYRDLENRTLRLRTGMQEIMSHYGLEGHTLGEGSIFNIVITEHPVNQIQDVLRSNFSVRKKLDFSILNQGIFIKPLNRFSLSTAHTDEIIAETLNRFEAGVKQL